MIECDDGARVVEFKQAAASPTKRQAASSAGSGSETSAVDCLLADKEGPVVGCMWAEAAADLLRIRNARKPTDPKPLLLFEGVRIVTLKETVNSGKILTPLKVMHSVRSVGMQTGTKISISPSATSPHTMAGVFRPPSAAHCITNFSRYRAQLGAPPCRGTFQGMIDNVQALDTTQQGKPKLSFELIDGEGTAIPVIAIARNANRAVMKAHMEVVIFNGTVRAGLGASAGGMYLFKDAMIVPIGVKEPPTTKVRSIDT